MLLIIAVWKLMRLVKTLVRAAMPSDAATLETMFEIAEAPPTSLLLTQSIEAACADTDANDIPTPLNIIQ